MERIEKIIGSEPFWSSMDKLVGNIVYILKKYGDKYVQKKIQGRHE